MQHLSLFLDIFIHLDKYLEQIVAAYGPWVYCLLFIVIFCETGLVATPFLPGDSLLFAAGAISSLQGMNVVILLFVLSIAAIGGDFCNYAIGRYIGPKVFYRDNTRFLNKEHLNKARLFYEKHGGKAIIIARFLPILRTFAPFVAGVGGMETRRFAMFNILGGILWIFSFTLLGYWFGQQKIVKENFSIVVIAIIVISLLPIVIEILKQRRKASVE